MFYLIILIFIIIILFWIVIVYKYTWKKKWISQEKKEFLIKNFKRISTEIDKSNQIIHFDKLYHKILLEIWYEWTFWEILKNKPVEINNLNKIWELHKLRNKLVHDFDLLENVILSKKAGDYKKEIDILLKKI